MTQISPADQAQKTATDAKPAGSRASESTATAGQSTGKTLPPATSNAPPPPAVSVQQRIDKAVASLNDYAQSLQRDLRFALDEELGRPVVRVFDRKTQELIRQIPNETALRLARNLKSIQVESEARELRHAAGGVDTDVAGTSFGLIDTRV